MLRDRYFDGGCGCATVVVRMRVGRLLGYCLVVASLVGLSCHRGESRREPVTPQPIVAPAPLAPAPDPWDVTSDPEAPPTLAERKRLADEACPRVAMPYFYRIEKAGKVSHVLGTRHVGVSLAKFPRAVHDALDAARLVVFEVAPGDDATPASSPVHLPDEVGPALWERYRALVGTDAARALERATPSTALLMMLVIYEDIGAMLDLEIQRKAIAARVPTRGLETAQFQNALLAKLFDARMLRASIESTTDRAELADVSRRDLAEYCAGTDETPGMDEDLRRDLLGLGYTPAELDQIDEEMVFVRNRDWLPKLEPILKTGGAFIVVGADHLRGSRGVIALLAARGYKTTRVK